MTLPFLCRPVAAAVALAVLLGGCTAATADQGEPTGRATRAAGVEVPEGPGPDDRPDPALSGEPVPTLPPGDPGTGPNSGGDDADDGDDGDGDHSGGHGRDEEQRVTSVPDSALIDAETVGAVASGAWEPEPAGSGDCAAESPAGATASRSLTLTAAGSRLVQTVSAHATARAARDAVDALADRLTGCGFTVDGDPRLGEASVQLTRSTEAGQEQAVVLAVEGATVVLVGTGTAAEPGAWLALADLALGTACAAGVHGCH